MPEIRLAAQAVGVDSKIVGIDIPIPSPTAFVSDEPTKYFSVAYNGDPIPTAFADISSIVNWDKFGFERTLNLDYVFVRARIKELIEEIGRAQAISTADNPLNITGLAEGQIYQVGTNPVNIFANHANSLAIVQSDLTFTFRDQEDIGYLNLPLGSEEREIAARYQIGDQSDQDNDYTPEVTLFWNVEYHESSIEARYARRHLAEAIISREFPDYKGQILGEMSGALIPAYGNLISRYADYGSKGTVEDFHENEAPVAPAVADYLLSRPGTGFDNIGFNNKPWISRSGVSSSEVAQRIYSVLILGIDPVGT